MEREKTSGELIATVAFGPAAWSARCDCYNGHSSSSGRCNARNVLDPTRPPGTVAICAQCRAECPAGKGPLA